MALDPTQPFDPSAPTGYATNQMAQGAAPPPSAPTLIFSGYTRLGGGHPDDVRAGIDPDGPTRRPTYMTTDQFMSQFDNFDRDEFLKMRNLLIAAGIVPPGAEAYDVRNAFGNLLEQVADMTARGIKMSPIGYVKNLIRMNGIDPSSVGSDPEYGEDEDALFTGVKTQINRSIDEISEGEAFAALQQSLSQMLGRDPTDQEIRNFTFKTNQLAAANPAVTKTIARFKDGELTSQTTREIDPGVTGADIAQSAYEDAQANPEYAEYQASTVYFNAAMSALGAIGQT